jgi:hypothetical protein
MILQEKPDFRSWNITVLFSSKNKNELHTNSLIIQRFTPKPTRHITVIGGYQVLPTMYFNPAIDSLSIDQTIKLPVMIVLKQECLRID